MRDVIPRERIERMIFFIRGQKVMLDKDLAALYGVPTKALNQAVKRNRDRFPESFVFKLSEAEAERVMRLRSQIVTLKRGQHSKYLPYAFTALLLFERTLNCCLIAAGYCLFWLCPQANKRTLQRDLKAMVDKGLLVQEGGGPTIHYRLVMNK